jgi:hypothetical protein
MEFLRNAVAGVWNLLKPATAANPVIAETEATEKEIDLVIKKREGLTSYADAATTEPEKALVNAAATELVTSTNRAKPTKTNIKEKVVQIRRSRGTQRADDVEDKNLHDIDSKVNNSFTANRQAAIANNNNARGCDTLSNDLDKARGVVLDNLPIPISPEQAGQAVLAQAAQAAFNQALHQTGNRDIAQAAAKAVAATGSPAALAAQAAAQAAAPEFQAAEELARQAAQTAAQEAAAAQASPEAAAATAAHFARLVPQVGIASNTAFEADNKQYQANDELNRQKYECLPDVICEYNVADKEKLRQLRYILLQHGISTLQFRDSCVAESALQLAGILKNYNGWASAITDENTKTVSQLMMLKFTESWTSYLNCPASVDDESVDTQNRIFYNRVTSCLEALGTYSVFLSSPWAAYRSAEHIRYQGQDTLLGVNQPVGAYVPPPLLPPFGAPPPPPPPPPPAPAESYYDQVPIGPYLYVIGPILDFQNIEGRIFIYIKCYDNREYTAGTYFWVYRSQSEGLYRVFFKLVPHDSIEKGYDYTQATLVHFKLQLALNTYYERHAQRGIKNPIILNTLSRLNYFVGNMSYLQQPTFLDLFPNRANIIPSFYSIPGEGNTVWVGAWNRYQAIKPQYCGRDRLKPAGAPHSPAYQPGQPGQLGQTECCYVCLIPPTPVTPAGTLGMIGHYYTIDAHYGPIIHKGFPMPDIYSGMADIKREADYRAQLAAYFPEDPTHYNYKFSRHGSQYDNTYPYIFCFTTCCLTSGGSSFEFFLEPDRYKKTFWCQGFRDFTALMTPPPPNPANPATSPVLSPVLHVVIGSMLTEPDFYLLSIRYNILNVEPLKSYYSSDPRIAEYKKSTQVLMTLGTKERDGSIYQPSIDPYPRHSANRALKALRDTINTANIRYKRRIFSSNEENIKNQRLLVQDKVQRKIEMIKVIAAAAHNTSRTGLDADGNPLPLPLPDGAPTPAGIQVIRNLIQGAGGGVGPRGFYDKVTALRAKIAELLLLQGPLPHQGPRLRVILGGYMDNMIVEPPPIDHQPRTPYKDAINFIMASPSAAATAVIQYLSSQILLNGLTEFEDDLTDYALLCLKKNWLGGMMDNAYEAFTTMFGDQTHRRLYYFNNAGEFAYMGDNNFTCLDPSNPPVPDLYEHKSSFDEVKREAPTPQNPTGDYPVTVLTLANIYRLDCYYLKIPGNIVKSMSIIYQVSSTIVYTRDVNPIILQAIDMQKIPLSFLPDLPEVLAVAPAAPAAADPPQGMGGGTPTKAAKSTKSPKAVAAAAAVSEPVKVKKSPKAAAAAEKKLKLAENIKQQKQQKQQQQQLMGQISILQTQQTQLETEALTLGLTQGQLPLLVDLQTRVTPFVAQLPQLQGPLLQQDELHHIQQQTLLLLAQQPPALKQALSQVQVQASQQAQQQQAEQHQLMGQQTQQQQAEQRIKEEIERILGPMVYSFLFSEYTSCATHRRVASYGGFFAGKMMEYFFSTHMQLPSFFKYFESYLRICIQYNTTALIYDAGVPPYNLIEIPPGSSFKLPFFQYFQKMKIVLVPGSAADGSGNARYIETILQQKTADIKAISDFLTKEFMIDPDVPDNASVYSRGSTLSTASSSTNSSEGSKTFCSFDEDSIGSSGALEFFLLLAPLEGSVVDDRNYEEEEQNLGVGEEADGDAPGLGGGNKPRLTTVATTKRNRKYKSRSSPKRKSKSKSRHKRNSKVTNKTFCRKRKSYLSRKPFKKQTLRKGVKR